MQVHTTCWPTVLELTLGPLNVEVELRHVDGETFALWRESQRGQLLFVQRVGGRPFGAN